jgi:hypothetical protein
LPSSSFRKSSNVRTLPPKWANIISMPRRFGAFSARIVNPFGNFSSSPTTGTGPIARIAPGSIERTYLMSRYASSHVRFGETIAASRPAAESFVFNSVGTALHSRFVVCSPSRRRGPTNRSSACT